jgi:regulator of protease activity HflC (stomatin/prohibitin superfamily)
MGVDLILLLFVCTALVAGAGLRRVPEGQVCTLHRFGRFRRALPPGWHFTLPVADKLVQRVPLIGHHVELAAADAAGRAEVFFQILDPARMGAELEDVDRVVERALQERLPEVRRETAEAPALALRLKDELNARLRGRGVHVTRCRLA